MATLDSDIALLAKGRPLQQSGLTWCDASSWLTNAFTGNQTDCQKQQEIDQAQADIQQTADNAIDYGLLDEETAQDIADTQKAAAAGNMAALQKQQTQCATTLPLLGCVKDWEDFLAKAKQDLVYIFVGLILLVFGIWFIERKLGI